MPWFVELVCREVSEESDANTYENSGLYIRVTPKLKGEEGET